MKNRTQPLVVGSAAPACTLRGANGEGAFSLSKFLSRGPLVIEFLRGTWRGNCRKPMAQFELHKKTLDDLGVQIIERRYGIWRPAKYLAQHPISFPFLVNEDRSGTTAYGLYHASDRDAWRIAHPATLVVDRTGLVQHIYLGAGQTDRSDLDTLLAVLRRCVRMEPLLRGEALSSVSHASPESLRSNCYNALSPLSP